MPVTPRNTVKPLNVIPFEILGTPKPRPENTIRIVVTQKITKEDLDEKEARANLIKLTEKLAEEAKSGVLKGLGGFASYEHDYVFWLEGSCQLEPGSAVLPLEHLKYTVMQHIVKK